MKRYGPILALLLTLIAAPCLALGIGSFNIEYFSVAGPRAYSHDDCATLARRIEDSRADLIALQEIEGRGALEYLTLLHLPDWAVAGNDTASKQDLFFLYNRRTLTLVDGPVAYFANSSFNFQERTVRLFDRPLLVATFIEKSSGTRFTVVNLHLKSGSTRGKNDRGQAQAYNDAKRQAQIERINSLASTLKGPVFFAGDYNDPSPRRLAFPLAVLPEGHYSYDSRRCNLDYIGYQGFKLQEGFKLSLREIEMSLPRRSTRKSQHPDHDLVILDIRFLPPTYRP